MFEYSAEIFYVTINHTSKRSTLNIAVLLVSIQPAKLQNFISMPFPFFPSLQFTSETTSYWSSVGNMVARDINLVYFSANRTAMWIKSALECPAQNG
jgi:hypothetical protein